MAQPAPAEDDGESRDYHRPTQLQEFHQNLCLRLVAVGVWIMKTLSVLNTALLYDSAVHLHGDLFTMDFITPLC